MMIQARTGSGKTGAFVLPMLERLDPGQRHVQAVILVPTRELARQVWQHANTLFGGSGTESVALYGGGGFRPQNKSVRERGPVGGGPARPGVGHLAKGTVGLGQSPVLLFHGSD